MSRMVVSIADYGAIPCDIPQTEKIQKAIDSCFLNGGGEVRIPEGRFITGGLRLRSNVSLHLMKNSILKGTRDPEDYMDFLQDRIEPLSESALNLIPWAAERYKPGDTNSYRNHLSQRWSNALIRLIEAENASVTGDEGSVIDGSNCYDAQGEEDYRGPHAISAYCCKNLSFTGYKVVSSSNWAHAIFDTVNITADSLTVIAGHDGFHTRSCDNVSISNCRFNTGDDCIAGFDINNMVIKDCEINTACNGIRLGGLNIIIERCRFYGPGKYLFRGSLNVEEKQKDSIAEGSHRYNMLSAFDYLCDYSREVREIPGNIVVKDCRIDNVDRLLQYNFSGNDLWQLNKSIKSFRFENITAAGIKNPVVVYGDADNKILFEMRNIEFSFREGFEKTDFIHTGNYENVILDNVNIKNSEGGAIIKVWSTDGAITLNNVVCSVPENERIKKAEEAFFSERI